MRRLCLRAGVLVALLCACPAVSTAVRPAATSRGPALPARSDRARVGTLDVPSLGLGTIKWSLGDEADTARLQATFGAALSAGIDFFDTAERYGAPTADLLRGAFRAVAGGGERKDAAAFGGSGEALLGRFARAAAYDDEGLRAPVIASKFTPVPWRTSPESVVAACSASADRLGVQSLDLFQVHMPDVIQPFKALGVSQAKDAVYWEGLARCYERGLAKNVGVSNYGPTLLERAHSALGERGVPLASNQINFSLLYRRPGAQATVDRCLELGVTPLAYYPLAMGVLSGNYDRVRLPADVGLRGYFLGDVRRGIPKAGVDPLLAELHRVAAARDRTPAQVALNWVMCKGAVPLAGASRPDHVASNAGALGWRLSAAEVRALEDAADACAFDFAGSGMKTSDSKFVGYGFEKWTLN